MTDPRHDFWCAECGKRMFRSRSSLPQGQACCQPCRRKRRAASDERYRSPCLDCGVPSYGERCRSCANKAQQIRSDDDRRLQRWRRACAAPGLNSTQRAKLLAHWKARQATCIFCGELATTIDHLVPLVRGGTNFEGNLAPACKRCNSSKGGKFVSEWQHDRRPGYMRQPLPWVDKRQAKAVLPKSFAPESPISICPCGAAHLRNSEFCSEKCAMRINYRRRVGIPDDAPLDRRGRRSAVDTSRAA